MKTKENGITLVSLAVTIVLMLILAGFMLSADTMNGDALNLTDEKIAEAEILSIKEAIKTDLSENPPTTYEELITMIKSYGIVLNEEDANNAKLITTNGNYSIYIKDIWNLNVSSIYEKNITEITGNETRNVETKDKLGNKIVLPAGFKVVNPNDDVTDGIVIEDVSAGDEVSKRKSICMDTSKPCRRRKIKYNKR